MTLTVLASMPDLNEMVHSSLQTDHAVGLVCLNYRQTENRIAIRLRSALHTAA
jgi:hypothetical protein